MEIKKILSLFSLFISCNLISKSSQQGFEIDDEIDDEINDEIDDVIDNNDEIDKTSNGKCINDIIFGNQLLKNECCDSLYFKCQGTTLTEMYELFKLYYLYYNNNNFYSI